MSFLTRIGLASLTLALLTGLLILRGPQSPEVTPIAPRGPELLLVAATPGGSQALIRVRPDGGDPRTLLELPASILGLSVAPDGSRAIVSLARDPQRAALILVDLAAGSTQPLVDDPAASASEPAWSGSQEFIVYVRRSIDGAQIGPPRLWLASPDGTSYGPLLSGDQQGAAPAWSPDGNLLAYSDPDSGEAAIYTFFSDSRRALGAGGGQMATWSPDSAALAYAAAPDQPGAPRRIRRWELAREQGDDLTDGQSDDHSPAWSPDGAQIAFVRSAADPAASGVWLIAPAGGPQRQLTASAQDGRPRWSPDGSRLALIRADAAGAAGSLWVVDVASGAAQQVADGALLALWLP